MFLFDSEEVLEHTANIVYKETQIQELSLALTVSNIYSFSQAGSLDFGGSEFEPAGMEVINPVKQSENDDYGWWMLEEGTYKVELNESLHHLEDTLVVLSLHTHARRAGIIANTQLLTPEEDPETLNMVFRVPPVGCNIKENARIAKVQLMAE